jgi:hypothetical protein
LLQPKDIGMEMSKINRKTSEITWASRYETVTLVLNNFSSH